MGRLLVFGTSHAVAPAHLRDGLHMDETAAVAFLERLAGCAGIHEIALLHTCTRLEVYALCSQGDTEAVEAAILAQLAGEDEERHAQIRQHSYALTERAAAHHLLRVAAGLDSIVLGESQILGQVRDAARVAADVEVTGPILRRLFAAGVRAGKRARAETDIARGPTSLAAAAVRLALQASDDFPARTVLIVGAGETASLAARHVAKRHPRRLVVANRSTGPAARLASELAGEAAGLDEVRERAEEADVVIAATSAPEPILRADDILATMQARPDRPLVIVDLGRPRNVEAPRQPVPGLTVHDLDGLAGIVERNRKRQLAELSRVEAIVEEELQRFLAWQRSRAVLPHVRALRQHFFEVGRQELASRGSSLEGEQRRMLEIYTEGLIAKLLHEPTVRIKQADSDSAEGLATLEALESLFDLDL